MLRKLGFVSAFVALASLVIAIVFPFVIHSQIMKQVHGTIVLDSKHAAGFSDWQDNTKSDSQPIYFQLYFFNLTNPHEVLRGSRPILHQLGPYSYREYTIRFNISWSDNRELLTYRSRKYFVFDAASSGQGLSESDRITTINLALLGVKANLEQGKETKKIAHMLMRCVMCNTVGPTPFQTRPIKELFWGYENDPVLQFVKENLANDTSTTFAPLQPNHTSFDMAYLTTNTNTQHTGVNHPDKLFQMVLYQNMSVMSACLAGNCPNYQSDWSTAEAARHGWTLAWRTVNASQVQGTDGTQFARPISGDDNRLGVFVDTLYRAAYLASRNWETVRDLYDIPMTRYRLRGEDLKNATNNPGNADYYMLGPDGLMNFTSVAGLPLFVSKPHFLDSDPGLVSSVRGLNPSELVHDTYIDVENFTAIALRAAKRIQFAAPIGNWDLRALKELDVDAAAKGLGKCVEHDCLLDPPSKWKWNISSAFHDALYLPFVW
eukprot:c5599_g1_i2.p1 GENE.c5599_g1_i2~~c5599_g1_i2.p1  ORF type:complete len:490 (+),score=93.01 c5599_g1_i2:37-1506(+)